MLNKTGKPEKSEVKKKFYEMLEQEQCEVKEGIERKKEKLMGLIKIKKRMGSPVAKMLCVLYKEKYSWWCSSCNCSDFRKE